MLDYVDLKNERLCVHERDLATLVRNNSFVECIYHIITGIIPTYKKSILLNQCLKEGIYYALNNKVIDMSIYISKPEIDPINVLIANLAMIKPCESLKFIKYIKDIFGDTAADLSEIATGIYLISIVPLIIKSNKMLIRNSKLYKLFKKYDNYIECILNLLADTNQSIYKKVEKVDLFDKILVTLHAGFGFVTPTIVLARFSASTKASITMNLIAGLCGSGEAHVGACTRAMELFSELSNLNDDHAVREHLNNMLNNNQRIPGFGHPLLNIDPRPSMLEEFTNHFPINSQFLNNYSALKSLVKMKHNINPNVDGIVAALLRMPTMLAHALDKKSKPAFGLKKEEARERFNNIPVNWI
jgi:citrate synthase